LLGETQAEPLPDVLSAMRILFELLGFLLIAERLFPPTFIPNK
jgi:hypothetical protein